MNEGSITRWFGPLSEGDEHAVAVICDRYFDRLVNYARRQLASVPRRSADEEDVVLSALNCFAGKAIEGQYADLHNRTDLWKLLLTFTTRKASDERKRQTAAKRGGRQVRGESVFAGPSESTVAGWQIIAGDAPNPASIAMLNEQVAEMLASLPDDSLRHVATLRFQAYSVEEIAEHLKCTKRTVIRKLNRIREKWTQGYDDSHE